MQGISNHIISKFRWDTSFDQKERASELQERLSGWSRMNMQKEIADIFDKVCPPEQTWRIDLLELSFGVVNFNDLEFELALKLRQMLNEILVDLIIHANKTGRSNIEILNEDASHISVLRSFFLEGTMPWNYKPAGGSLNEMVMYQLQNNRRRLIEMLREVGAVNENVRKRIAWQINDTAITKIIEGLEPNNHSQIIDFSSEMVKIQMKETVVQASTVDFKRNLWLWILNYLLTERGTIFSKVAFMRSSIRQMAMYYNIAYDELFELIERAVDSISKISGVKSDFILTLKILSKENSSSKNKAHAAKDDPAAYRERLKLLFENKSLRAGGLQKAEFNELVAGLFKQDQQAFRALIIALGDDSELWVDAINDLNDASLEVIVTALSPANAVMIMEIIYFIHRLGRKLNPAVKRKMLWKTGIRFLQEQKNGSFTSSMFLNYCITAISEKNKQLKPYLLDQLMNAKPGASAKVITTLDLYAELNTVFIQELTEKDDSFFEINFKELLKLFGKALVSTANDKEVATALKRSIVRSMQLQPKQALQALMEFREKETLRRILPHVLNEYTVRLLLKHVKNETTDLLSCIRQAVTELKAVERSVALAEAIDGMLFTSALQLVIFYPSLSAFSFLELLLEELSEHAGSTEELRFSVFTELLFRDEKLNVPGISKAAAAELRAKYAVSGKRSVSERIVILAAASKNKQQELVQTLKNSFSAKELLEIKTLKKEESEMLLDTLVSNGKQLLETLVKEYAALLRTGLSNYSEKETIQQLTTLFWKCILNYKEHRGSAEMLKRLFKAAVVYTFPVKDKNMFLQNSFMKNGVAERMLNIAEANNPQSMEPEAEKSAMQAQGSGENKTGAGESNFYLKNSAQLPAATLFNLIKQGLTEGALVVEYKGETIQLKELIGLMLKKDPAALRQLIKATAMHREHQLQLLKKVVSFDTFCSSIMNDAGRVLKEEITSLYLLHELFTHIASANLADELLKDCWEISLDLITGGTQSVKAEIKKMLKQMMYKLEAEKNLNAVFILSVMKDKNIQLTPLLKTMLAEALPGLSVAETQIPATVFALELQKAGEKGLLPELCIHIISHKNIPAWFENTGEQKPETLLNELIMHDSQTFFDVVKQEIITEQQFNWLHQSVDLKTLIRCLGTLNKNRQPLLSIFESFYHSMVRISVKGISEKEIRSLLFRKLLKAGTSGNWRIISTEQILNELTWDVCVKRGIAKKDFFQGIGKIKNQLPLGIQVALEQLKDTERTSLAASVAAIDKVLPAEPIMPQLQTNKTKLAKGGIPVKNAGMVLISNYVEILLERLKLTAAKKFADETARTDAPHYLQYVVTGLSATEESLLPLNKVLCGMPLSEPLRNGIAISDDNKKLIDGLLKAMIGYWPAIGNCSVDGFRGNWLVREGLLTEHEDKWELTVEKRAYDVLIHQSPFSFSIIKFPWMSKPLHVTWPY